MTWTDVVALRDRTRQRRSVRVVAQIHDAGREQSSHRATLPKSESSLGISSRSTPPRAEDAKAALSAFEDKWGRRHERSSSSWRNNWKRVVPFLDFPPEIRRVIYTTNQIEALDSSIRKLLHYCGRFPNDEAVTKILFLALRRVEKKWTRTMWNWSAVLGQFAGLSSPPKLCDTQVQKPLLKVVGLLLAGRRTGRTQTDDRFDFVAAAVRRHLRASRA
ncbi:MAG: transposase [Planctomycetota bacterium]